MDIWKLPRNEKEAVHFLQKAGILHTSRFCRNGHAMKLYFSGNIKRQEVRWRCNSKHCVQCISIRTGTWFTNSRIPLLTVVRFMYCWSEEITSSRWCKKQLGLAAPSTTDWNHYMREACMNALESSQPTRIGGENKTVEIDLSLISKRKKHLGKLLPQQWIFCGVCRESKDIFMKQVPDGSAATLLTFIKDCIEPGSSIVSGCWKVYKTEELSAAGCQHLLNHSYIFVEPASIEDTRCVQEVLDSLKSRNKKQMGTSQHHLKTYLAEYLWRQQMLNAGKEVFDGILEAIRSFWPPQSEGDPEFVEFLQAREESVKARTESIKALAESVKNRTEGAIARAEAARLVADAAKARADSAKARAECAQARAQSTKVGAETVKSPARTAKAPGQRTKVSAKSSKARSESVNAHLRIINFAIKKKEKVRTGKQRNKKGLPAESVTDKTDIANDDDVITNGTETKKGGSRGRGGLRGARGGRRGGGRGAHNQGSRKRPQKSRKHGENDDQESSEAKRPKLDDSKEEFAFNLNAEFGTANSFVEPISNVNNYDHMTVEATTTE